MRQILLYFSVAGKFCLAHGLSQLTRDVKSDIRTLNFRIDVTFSLPLKTLNNVRRKPSRIVILCYCIKSSAERY